MIYTLEDFIREYSNIVNMGWVKTHRAGPTGIGKTLEDLLGIQENNIDGPDFGDYELKSGPSIPIVCLQCLQELQSRAVQIHT